MYPQSFLWWLGGTMILFGIIGLIGLLAWAIEKRFRKHDDEDGRSSLWFVFEVLSAILVITSLLVAIYSDNKVLRAIAGIALVVVVSAATVSLLGSGKDKDGLQ